MSAISHSSCDWQEGFLRVLPAIRTHARIHFRRLDADRRQEAVQETLAVACVNFQVAAAQGKLAVVRAGPLADFAVRHVTTGRHGGGRQDTARDVMSASRNGDRRSVALELIHGKCRVGVGNVTIPANEPIPLAGSVVEVRYLYAYDGGSLCQPVYLGRRDDVAPKACLLTQLKIKAVEESL